MPRCAARLLLPHLERGQPNRRSALRAAMERAFGGSDADGAWDWKTAYDACEAATVLFLRKFGPAMRARAASPAGTARHAGQGRGAAAVADAPLRGEPGASAVLDADRARLRRRHRGRDHAGRSRARALGRDRACSPSSPSSRAPARPERTRRDPRRPARTGSFPASPVTRHDAAHIHDHLDGGGAAERRADEPAILGRGACRGPRRRRGASAMSPRRWRASPRAAGWSRSPAPASLPTIRPGATASSACRNADASCSPPPIDGRVYARHGTTVDTRLTVIDRVPADDPTAFPASPGMAPDAATLLDWVTAQVPPRLACRRRQSRSATAATRHRRPHQAAAPSAPSVTRRRPRSSRRPSSSPTRPSTGSRPRAAASPRRSMRLRPAVDPYSRCAGRIRPGSCSRRRWPRSRRPSPATGRICRPTSSPMAFCRTRSSRASSMPARPMPAISPDRGSSTRPSMSSRPRRTTPRTPCASAAAGCWATAPAPARAARSPASSSTTG